MRNRNRFKDIWYYKHTKLYLQRRKISRARESFSVLIKIAPIKAMALLFESVYKIVLPLGMRSRILFWFRRKFHITPSFYQSVTACGINEVDRDEHVIVTLTSYPQRIKTVYKVINTLLMQTYKPDMVVLWLAPEQFPNKENDLPIQLRRLCEYGLTIDWYHDIKSFKKLIPALKNYPNSIVVTADDDVYYPPNWLETLMITHRLYPRCIVCHRAHAIKVAGDGKPCPYKQWKFGVYKCRPSYDILPIGVGGTLYMSKLLLKEVFKETIFMRMCPYADDIWFWSMAVLNGTLIKVVDQHVKKIYPIYEADNSAALATLNMMDGNRNDEQLTNILNCYPELLARINANNNEC